jgi:acetyl esterase/lipase
MQISNRLIYASLAIVPGLGLPLATLADGGYLRTAPPLDESRGYCLDVAGFGDNARPDEALRVHTCKYGEDNVDQLFKWVDDKTGHVAIPAYNRCLAAGAPQAGSQLFVMECTTSDLQAWTFVPNGNLSLRTKPGLCVTVGDERHDAGSEPLVSPGYGWRSSTLEVCRERGDPLQDLRWGREDEHRRGMANALRDGMPEEIAEGIRVLGNSMESGIVSRTAALYREEPYVYRQSEVEVTENIAYGAHERQRLDVHIDTRRRDFGLQPVVVFFHGGGFVRGSKESSRNVADYFASIGLVGVNATYRLAPEIQWPEGARDVGAAVNWVSENIKKYGGDPTRIFLIGKSAGASHIATYVFQPEVAGAGTTAAGAILISGSYATDSSDPPENHIAYYGEDFASWPEKQVIGHISRAEIPVMMTTSEFDPRRFEISLLALANELASEHGMVPRIRQLPGHNHYSSNMSIGTADRMLSDEILDFVMTADVE